HRIGDRVAHQGDRFAEQEDLHFVAGLGEAISVHEGESRLGGIVRAPGALDQYTAHGLARLRVCTGRPQVYATSSSRAGFTSRMKMARLSSTRSLGICAE